MGDVENRWLNYLDDPFRFAGLVNGWLMQGQQEFRASDVEQEDRRLDQAGNRDRRKKKRLSSRYRDLSKRMRGCRYRLIVGTELSVYRDYRAPVRMLDYDALEYQRQVKWLENSHGRERDLRGDEKMSGLSKSDRLIPVVDLYLYTGVEAWDAPVRLHDMLEWEGIPGSIRQYVEDYHVRLLDIVHTPDERLQQFPEELAGIFLFIKYQNDKRKLREITERMPVFSHMSRDGFELTAIHTNARELLNKEKEGEEDQDMCRALKEMIKEGEARGEVRGKAEMVLAFLQDLGDVPEKLAERISRENDLDKLLLYGKKAARAESVEQFMEEMGA